VTVTDGNGTVYSFPNSLVSALPTTVTDRNGNIISISTGGPPTTLTDTLGRSALSVGSFGSTDNITVAGLSSSYQVSWTTASASFTINAVNLPSFLNSPCPTSMSGSVKAVSRVTLPNGQNFTLAHDPTYGMLNKMTYPSGGYVRYVWGLAPQEQYYTGAEYDSNGNTAATFSCRIDYPAITDRYVSFNGTSEVLHQHFSYSTSWQSGSGTWTTKTTTVTTTDQVRNTSFSTVYSYSPTYAPCVPDENPNANDDGCVGNNNIEQVPVEQCIEYYDASGSGGTPPSPCPNLNPPGKLLKTEIKSWYKNDPRTLGSVQTVLDNGQSSLTVNCYNANEQLTETDSFDLGTTAVTLPSCANNVPSGTTAGPFLRKTVETYAAFTQHIVDLPSTVITYDGSGNRAAETDYPSYDANGNLKTETKQCFVGSQACPQGNSTTTYTYDSHGQMLTMVDPKQNPPTSYSYTDNYSPCGGSAPPTSPSDAYPTQVTDAAGHTTKFCYDYIRALMLSSTDQNNQTTTYTYADPFDRLTQTSYPDGGQTTYSYNDIPPSPTMTSSRLISSGKYLTNVSTMDGMGQVVQNQLTSDPDCAAGDRTDTAYDGFGRVLTVSNPYCATSDPTYGLTTYAYDGLGRTTQVTHPDNSMILTTYAGRATEVQDEGNGSQRVTRVSQTDGLGRLVSVCEVSNVALIGQNAAPDTCSSSQDLTVGDGKGFPASYLYDVLGNLTRVNQGTMAPRTFAYDSLSRLTSATNPESGTITYAYDANGNLSKKTGPLQNQTGSSTVVTSYTYDALNRLTQKSYNDGATPISYYYYDSYPNVNSTNATGRLVLSTASSAVGGCITSLFSYDAMGRINQNTQYLPPITTCAANYSMPYTYDLMGNMTSYYNGYYNPMYLAYNTAGRVTGLTSAGYEIPPPTNLLSNVHYNAAGQITSDALGNGETESFSYDTRMRLQSRTSTSNSAAVYSFSLNFAPDGNVTTANDSVNGNWNYSYDQFNRLACSSEHMNFVNKTTGGESAREVVSARHHGKTQNVCKFNSAVGV